MRHVRQVMGTAISLDVRDELAEDVVEAAFAELVRTDALFSPFRPDSELSRLDRGALALSETSPEVREVLGLADAFERASGGVFRVARAGRLDANGIVKGWAAERAARVLAAGGASAFCLNAGGDVLTRGAPAAGARWHVGVRSPFAADRLLGVLALGPGDGAVATSGAYERGAHIVDARDGRVAAGFASVTVLDADLTVADVLATTVYAMGPDGPRWAHDEFGCSVVTVGHDGHLAATGPVAWAKG